jgi:hypothetical protein
MQSLPLHGTRFRLNKQMVAVKLSSGADADYSLDTHGVAVQIAQGEIVEVRGKTHISGTRYVVWDGDYVRSEQDLLANSEQV